MSASETATVTCPSVFNQLSPHGSLAPEHPLLATRNLGVQFQAHGQRVEVVKAISFDVFKRATLAIIGESGSGKSISSRAILGVLPTGARATGSVRYAGQEILGLTEAEMRRYRGRSLAMVFQDAERALNPTMQIGHQISEAVCAHDSIGRKAARHRVLELLHLLRLPQPRKLFFSYPHELSGGMRQRVMIAVAIAASPKLLIADEPTSALDVSTGIGIMELLRDLQRQLDMALILVSHDLRLVANFADTVLVMQGGRAIEYADTSRLIAHPQMEYTKALLDAIPRFETRQRVFDVAVEPRHGRTSPPDCGYRPIEDTTAMTDARTSLRGAPPLLRVSDVVQELPVRRVGWTSATIVQAICDVSFDLLPGEILGIVGETGAGKSTLVRTLLQIPPPTSGSVWFRGHELTQLRGRRLWKQRRQVQMIFQDPFASLNPKWRVAEIVEEPLLGHGFGDRNKRLGRVEEVLGLVGLPSGTYGSRRPVQLSGGECQRVAIARALAIEPQLIICDEALASLDALTQTQIVDLFHRLRAKLDLAFIFISHDIARVREISDRVVVMYLGQLCEIGPARVLCHEPFHPYMAALLDSVVLPHPHRSKSFERDRPSLSAPPSGCRFHTRCDRAQERCALEKPPMRRVADHHFVACHYPMRSSGLA